MYNCNPLLAYIYLFILFGTYVGEILYTRSFATRVSLPLLVCPPWVLQFAVNKRECSIIIIISYLPLYCVERISRYHNMKFTTIHLSRPRDLLFPPSSLLRNQTRLSSLSLYAHQDEPASLSIVWYTKDPLALNCKSFTTRISEVGAYLSLSPCS